jgi:2-hydroxychromene-2-carboxylate isomerase
LLGALFRAIGTPIVPIAEASEPKRRYLLRDMQVWAEHWGVPLVQPSRFPLRTVKALRLTLLAPERARVALIHRLMRAAWVDDADVEADDALRGYARDCGVDEGLVGELGLPHAKELLLRATDDAVRRDVPGAPAFVVDGHVFWGQDRLDFVGKTLRGWRPSVG